MVERCPSKSNVARSNRVIRYFRKPQDLDYYFSLSFTNKKFKILDLGTGAGLPGVLLSIVVVKRFL